MFDCAKEVLGYHNDEVTLPQADRTAMRNRRDANRRRVKKGLEENGDPSPLEFCPQGSYAMKTMVQHPANDYDIDDGIYFDKEDLKGAKGAYKSALQARQMVRDGVDDGKFKTAPEVRGRIAKDHASAVVMDLTGVKNIDSQVSHHLIQIVHAIQLMGSNAIITGIQPEIARALVSLNIDLANITTRASLSDGLKEAFRLMDIHVGRKPNN